MATAPARIFVVDDDDSVRTSIRRLLRSAGFQVEAFASGQQFLSRMPPPTEGIVILDLRMPALNGLDVQCELRRRGTTVAVIFKTG
jgi:FixJ family two-component response regulator